MNVLFTDTITVYNHYRDEDTDQDMWNRTVVKGVQWSHNAVETVVSNGVQTEVLAESITIDFQRSYGNKPYADPAAYRKMDDDARSGYWTLDARDLLDIVVLGVSENDITSEYRLKHLQEDFQYAVTVRSVSDKRNRQRLKHIKVVAV